MHQSDFRVEIVFKSTWLLRLLSVIHDHLGQIFQVQIVSDLSMLYDLIDFVFSSLIRHKCQDL